VTADRPPLAVTGLVVGYGATIAVGGVDLRVDDGERVALIGPNGAGKSTLVDAVAGLVPIRSGTVAVGGRVLDARSVAQRRTAGLAHTHQTPALMGPTPQLEVAVAAGPGRAVLRGALRPPSAADHRVAGELLDLVGLPVHVHHAPSSDLGLSDQRRVELARALASRPDVILLDEPASGLSSVEREAFAAVLTLLSQRVRGVLLVEHDMALVAAVAHRVVAIDRGHVIAAGPFDVVMAHPSVRSAYLGLIDDVVA
jgi:branched-chain amino acid transport system ATP-binding protein